MSQHKEASMCHTEQHWVQLIFCQPTGGCLSVNWGVSVTMRANINQLMNQVAILTPGSNLPINE